VIFLNCLMKNNVCQGEEAFIKFVAHLIEYTEEDVTCRTINTWM